MSFRVQCLWTCCVWMKELESQVWKRHIQSVESPVKTFWRGKWRSEQLLRFTPRTSRISIIIPAENFRQTTDTPPPPLYRKVTGSLIGINQLQLSGVVTV